MAHGANINQLVSPFYIHTDLVDPWGNYFRGGTLFTILSQTEVQAKLSVRSLHNMFDTQDTIIYSGNYGLQPYEYMNIIQQLSQGRSIDLSSFGNGGIMATVTAGQFTTNTEPILPKPTQNPNARLKDTQSNTDRAIEWAKTRSAELKKAHTQNTNPIKKIYCPYNYDIIVYDNKNNRINDLCGELTPAKFYDIMKFVTKTTTFEGFDYFKEACFDLEVIPHEKEFENDDFAALEAMKTAKVIDLVSKRFADPNDSNEKWK